MCIVLWRHRKAKPSSRATMLLEMSENGSHHWVVACIPRPAVGSNTHNILDVTATSVRVQARAILVRAQLLEVLVMSWAHRSLLQCPQIAEFRQVLGDVLDKWNTAQFNNGKVLMHT
jgi:hypothetical protein